MICFPHAPKNKIQPVTFRHIMESVCQDKHEQIELTNNKKKTFIFHNIIYKEMQNR